MTDRMLVWFQCKNPKCPEMHRAKNKKWKNSLPVTFMSYVTGRLTREDFRVVLEPDRDDLPDIIIWHESEKSNSYMYPIKGLRYCRFCYNVVVNNTTIDSY